MDQLESLGYLVLRNVLTHEEVEQGRSCIHGHETMDYTAMRSFIEQRMLPAIDRQLKTEIQYAKFRVSNNNNSDAGALHRDIIPVRLSSPTLPIYTCLSYLDKTTMEIIPGTHKRITMTYLEALALYGGREQIVVRPNDLLIINSLVIHRGIFTENLPNRRIIQVFKCCLNKADFDRYVHQIVNVPGNEAGSDLSLLLYKNSYTAFIPNFFGYITTATGEHLTATGRLGDCSFDLTPFQFFSPEGLCLRVAVVPGTPQKLNLYCLTSVNITLPDSCIAGYMGIRYRQFAYFSSFLILLVLLFVVAVLKLLSFVRRTRTFAAFSLILKSQGSVRKR